nr:lipopolysaccharide biosynthesis protein [Calditrichia bacterium]
LGMGAEHIAAWYGDERITPIVYVLAGSFVLQALITVPRSVLEKELAFKKIVVAETGGIVVSGATAIFMALHDFGYWSLIVQRVILGTSSSVFVWIAARFFPRLIFDWAAVKELMQFSLNNLGSIMLAFWSDNIEKMMIGKSIGSASVGIYNRALNQMQLATSQIDTVLLRVMFPVLSSIQDEKERVKQIYLEAIGAITMIASPMMLGLLVSAKPFIVGVYGPNWAPAVPVLQILCLAGLLISINNTAKWIFMSQGRADWMLRWGLVSSFVLIAAKIIGASQGSVIWVAVAFVVGYFLVFYPGITIAGRLIGMNFTEVIVAAAGPFWCSLIMALLVWGMDTLIPDTVPHLLVLGLNMTLGAFSYIAMLHLFRIKAYLRIRNLLVERLKARGKQPDTPGQDEEEKQP